MTKIDLKRCSSVYLYKGNQYYSLKYYKTPGKCFYKHELEQKKVHNWLSSNSNKAKLLSLVEL